MKGKNFHITESMREPPKDFIQIQQLLYLNQERMLTAHIDFKVQQAAKNQTKGTKLSYRLKQLSKLHSQCFHV